MMQWHTIVAAVVGAILAYLLPSTPLLYPSLLYMVSRLRPACKIDGGSKAGVAVIIAAREEPIELLEELGRSLAKQTLKPRRIVLAWDGRGLEDAVKVLRKTIPDVEVEGFIAGCNNKACALNKALAKVEEDYIVVIDVDDRPAEPNYLEKSVSCQVVIPYWEPQTPKSSFGEAIATLLSFGSETLYASRCRLGRRLLLLGSGSSIYRKKLEVVGGFVDEVLEDITTGVKLLEENADVCFGENHRLIVGLPPNYESFRRQQCRWARGAIHAATLIARSRLPLHEKVEYLVYTLQYLFGSLQPVGLTILALMAIADILPTELVLPFFTLWLASTIASFAALYHHLANRYGYSWKSFIVVARASVVAQLILPRLLICSFKGFLGDKKFTKTPKKGRVREALVEEHVWAILSTILLTATVLSTHSLDALLPILPLAFPPLSLAYYHFKLRREAVKT